ncbi:hypothetical protein Tco_0340116 [Tanacetum coccineum]
MKVCKGKRSDHRVDEEPQPTPEIPEEDDKYNLQRGIQISLESFQAPVGRVAIHEPASSITQRLPVVEGKGKGIATDEQAAQSLLDLQKPKKRSTTDQYIFQRRIPVTQDASTGTSTQPQDDTSTNVVRDTPSPADARTGADTKKSNSEGDTEIINVDEERGEDASNMMALEERTVELDESQAGSDPSKTPKSRPLLEHVLMEEDQARSNPGQSHVLTSEEQVHLENTLSSLGTLSSMKNLDDAFTFGDQFLNDKPTEEEPCKANVETEVESMVTVPIYQTSSSAPPLSTPIMDLTPPKPVSPPVQEPVFTTTTTLPLPLPPPQQSTTDPALATRDKTTQALSSRVFTLANHDLYLKIDNYVNETVKEAVHNALQAPICECFRELLEFEMKEILHDRMFESGSYISHPKHAALYDALEVSMDRENMEEFIEATAKSRKKRRDDQDPPPPTPKDSD